MHGFVPCIASCRRSVSFSGAVPEERMRRHMIIYDLSGKGCLPAYSCEVQL